MSETVAQLAETIQIRAGLPANQDRFTTENLVPLMKQELQDTVLPFMYSLVEEFFVVNKLEPMQSPQLTTVVPDVSTQSIQNFDLTINGELFRYTSDATPTQSEVVTGLNALVNAGTQPVTARGTGSTLVLTSNNPNYSFTVVVSANLTETTVQGYNRFPDLLIPIPRRSFARGVRDLQFFNSSSIRNNIPQIPPEDIDIFSMTSLANFTTPAGFYFKNDTIALVGTSVAITGSLDISFYLRVPTLTSDTTQQAAITNMAWNDTTQLAEITVDTSTYSSAAGFLSGIGVFDLYRVSTGAYYRIDLTCAISGSGSTRTFTTAGLNEDMVISLMSGQAGGFPVTNPDSPEYLLVPQEVNPYSPIPAELDNLLVSAVCGRILESLGDTEGLATNMATMKKVQTNLAKIYADRAVGEAHKATNRRGIYNFMRRRFIRGRI